MRVSSVPKDAQSVGNVTGDAVGDGVGAPDVNAGDVGEDAGAGSSPVHPARSAADTHAPTTVETTVVLPLIILDSGNLCLGR